MLENKLENKIGEFQSINIKSLLLDLPYISSAINDFYAGGRFEKALLIVAKELPIQRGWYMTGREPCSIIFDIAKMIENHHWNDIDEVLLDRLPDIKEDVLMEWLNEMKVNQFCVNRLLLFLKHHKNQDYESATYLGIPLIDEVAIQLYNKDFTTKRGAKKPYIATRTNNDSPNVNDFCNKFVENFGLLHEDISYTRLSDENYWNRHAILHGMMKRSMSLKDSAKCLMAICFLIFALDDN